jgi:hypothetical protein
MGQLPNRLASTRVAVAPEPTGSAPAERLQRAVEKEHFDADARSRMSIKERLVLWGMRCHHAALSAGSARANPRRYPAALDAWLQAVKNARLSAFRSSIQEAI